MLDGDTETRCIARHISPVAGSFVAGFSGGAASGRDGLTCKRTLV